MDLQHPTACLTHGLMRTARGLARGFEKAAADVGLSASQFTALAMLTGHGSMTVSQIAAAVASDRTTMTRNLAVMARKGWIAEVETEDRRERIWTLTDHGREVINVAMPIWRDWQARLVDRMGAEGAINLLKSVKTLEDI